MLNFSDIKKIAERVFRRLQPTIRTTLIGQVVSYDDTTNTAEIQPVVNAVRFGDAGTLTKQLPVLADVPVVLPGSGKTWLTFGPAVGSYGVIAVTDREIATWLTNGGIVDPEDVRMHSLSDAVFYPGVVPLAVDGDNGAIEEPIATDRISLRTRSNLTEVSVLADETVNVNVNDGAATLVIDVDGNVTLTTDGAVTVEAAETIDATAGDTITLDNGTETLSIDGADVKAGTGTDYVAMATLLNTYLDALGNAVAPAGTPVVTPAPGAPCPVAVAIMASHSANAGGPPPAPVSFDSANLKAD
jgi:hypothetical protein